MLQNENMNNNPETSGVPPEIPPHGKDGHYLLASRIILIVFAVGVLALAAYGLYFYFSSKFGIGGQPLKNLSTGEKLELLKTLNSGGNSSAASDAEKLDILKDLQPETKSSGQTGGISAPSGSANITESELNSKLKALEALKAK